MFKRVLSLSIFALLFSSVFAANPTKGMNIKLTIKGLENSSMILANYFGDKQYVKDTIKFHSKGTITLKADTHRERLPKERCLPRTVEIYRQSGKSLA